MATFNRAKGFSVITPVGKALWCKAYEPDTKFNAKGVLSTQLILPADSADTKAFIKKLDSLLNVAFDEYTEEMGAKAKQWSKADYCQPEYDEAGEETGNLVFKFNLKDVADKKAAGKQAHIIIKDAGLKDITKEKILIGNGSDIRVGAFVYPYPNPSTKKVGITFMWQKLQIINLVAFGSDGDDDFDAVDGFKATTTTTKTVDVAAEDEDDLDF